MKDDIELYYDNECIPLRLGVDPDTQLLKFQVSDSEIGSPMYTTDRPAEARIPYLKEVRLFQNTWHGGAGQRYMTDPTMYADSIGMDASCINKLMRGPKVVKMTSLLDQLLCTGNTAWTASANVTCTADTGAYVTPLKSAKAAIAAGFTTGLAAYFNTPVVYNISAYNRIQAWVYSTVALSSNDMKLRISDTAAGSTAAHYEDLDIGAVAANTWTKVTLTIATPANFSDLRSIGLVVGVDKGAMDFYIDDIRARHTTTAMSFSGYGVKMVDFYDTVYFAFGQYLYKYTLDGTISLVCDCTYQITDLLVWGNYLLIARGLSYAYQYYDGATLTDSTSGHPMTYFALIKDDVWGSSSTYEVMSNSNPLNGGSWSTTTPIGNSNTVITSLINHPDTVVVGTDEGPYKLNSDGTVVMLEELLMSQKDDYTCSNIAYADGFLYIPTGSGGLFEYDLADQIMNRLSPYLFTGTVGTHLGKVLALHADTEYIYAALDAGATVELLRGRWEEINKAATWVWHPVGQVEDLYYAANNCCSVHISNQAGSKRLWILMASGTDGLYYMHVPTIYNDPSEDDDYRFNASAYLYSSIIRGDNPDSMKRAYLFTARMRNVSATCPISIYYRILETDSWTLLGTFDEDVMYAQKSFPDGVYGRQFEFLIEMLSADDTASAELESMSIFYAEYASIQDENQRFTLNKRNEFRVYGGADTFWEHADYAATPKACYCISVHSFGCEPAKKITVKYKLDSEKFWRTLSTRIDTSPWQTLKFPVDTICKIMYVDFVRDDENATELLTYVIDGKLMPDKQKQFTFSAHLADVIHTTSGSLNVGGAAAKMAKLREADNRKWPVRLKTFAGHDTLVTIEIMHELCMETGPNKSIGYWFTINATEAKGV